MADWGMHRFGRPQKDDQVRSSWLVLGLAVTNEPDPSLPDATYELRVDHETFHVRSHQGHLRPAYGPAASAAATITLTTDTLTAIASGQLDVPGPQADRLIAIDGDARAAQRLLESITRTRVRTDSGPRASSR